MKFDRSSGIEELKELLENESLYQDYLKDDSEVFMAYRNNAIDFYYCSSKIFTYSKSNGFTSHKKFCFNANIEKNYIKIDDIKNIKPIDNLSENYKLIKELAKKYSGLEGEGVGYAYKFKYDSTKEQKYILLDTEIALYEKNEKKNSFDRIDFLIYDIENRLLQFVEAKHFSNKELWSQKGSKPKVVTQVGRYKDKVIKYKAEILDEYKKYINLLDSTLKEPKELSTDVALYMFGFDNDQKNKIKNLLKDDKSMDGISHYFLGNPKALELEKLIKAVGK